MNPKWIIISVLTIIVLTLLVNHEPVMPEVLICDEYTYYHLAREQVALVCQDTIITSSPVSDEFIQQLLNHIE